MTTARFRILVTPDGQALVTTSDPLDEDAIARIRAEFVRWKAGEWPGVLLGDADVIRVESLELAEVRA